MEQRELDVTILSANNLKNVKLSGRKMSPYAVAYIYPNVKVSTTVAKQGGESPSWNCILHLSCDERLFQDANAHITVELYNHGKFSNKLIGTALVPLSAGKDSSEGKAKEYQVTRPSNKVQGTLNVSVIAGKVVTLTPSAPPPTPQPVLENKEMPGYPVGYNDQASGSQPQFPSQLHQQPYIPPPGYQPQFAQQAYYQQQAYQRPRQSRFGGGLGAGLLGGALGGLFLGSALDGGFGGGDYGGGGFGDGGGGFGDGGGDFGGGGDF